MHAIWVLTHTELFTERVTTMSWQTDCLDCDILCQTFPKKKNLVADMVQKVVNMRKPSYQGV